MLKVKNLIQLGLISVFGFVFLNASKKTTLIISEIFKETGIIFLVISFGILLFELFIFVKKQKKIAKSKLKSAPLTPGVERYTN